MRIPAFLIRSRWTTALLLAVYGTAGLLGYGLHTLGGCEHSVPASAACETEHEHACCSHHCSSHTQGQHSERNSEHHGSAFSAAPEVCPICEFLVQAQSPHYFTVEVECAGATTEATPLLAIWHVALLLGEHPARGPPGC